MWLRKLELQQRGGRVDIKIYKDGDAAVDQDESWCRVNTNISNSLAKFIVTHQTFSEFQVTIYM